MKPDEEIAESTDQPGGEIAESTDYVKPDEEIAESTDYVKPDGEMTQSTDYVQPDGEMTQSSEYVQPDGEMDSGSVNHHKNFKEKSFASDSTATDRFRKGSDNKNQDYSDDYEVPDQPTKRILLDYMQHAGRSRF